MSLIKFQLFTVYKNEKGNMFSVEFSFSQIWLYFRTLNKHELFINLFIYYSIIYFCIQILFHIMIDI